jgi:hypothetical protein
MTAFTTAEKLENVRRTIAATEAKIAELQEVNKANKIEEYQLRSRLAEEARKASLENSPKARWDRAVKSLRKSGVHFRTNVMKCCRGCITEQDLNLKDVEQPYGYTFGGQDMWVKFNEDGQPYEKADRWERRSNGYDYKSPEKVFINHGNDAGAKIAEAFRTEGFTVEYDGTDYNCVEIKF